jgi:hypothetical protein
VFAFNETEKLSEHDLKRYQEKLLDIKSRFEDDDKLEASFGPLEKLNHHHSNENIFASFGNLSCSKHDQVFAAGTCFGYQI